MEFAKYSECKPILKKKVDQLYEQAFPPNLYNEINPNTTIAYDNLEPLGLIEISNATSYFSIFVGMTMSSEFLINPLPEFSRPFDDDFYIHRMAINEKYRNKSFGSEILNNSLDELVNTYQVNNVWTLVTEDNPSDYFWLKNGFEFRLRFTAPNTIENTFFPPAKLFGKKMR